MKKFNHPTDKFLRETFRDHRVTPSEAAKKAFLADVMQKVPPPRKGRNGLILLSALLLLAGAGIIFWSIPPDESPTARAPQPEKTFNTSYETRKPVSSDKPSSIEGSRPDHKIILTGDHHKNQSISNDKSTYPRHQHKSAILKRTAAEPVKKNQTGAGEVNPSNTPKTPSEKTKNQEVAILSTAQPDHIDSPSVAASVAVAGSIGEPSSQVMAEPPSSAGIANAAPSTKQEPSDSKNAATLTEAVQKTDTIAGTDLVPREKGHAASDLRNPWIPTVGVYYTPEWMFNTLEGTKFVNNFGIEGTFHFGPFSIRTGAGLSIGKGTHELMVEYNDFLGAYNKLDSMQFTWNDPTHTYIPTMYMSQQDVWDSLMKLDYARVIKRYTYLQIPLILGYDFWQAGRISFGLRVGPVLSVLAESKQLSADYDPGKKRIISINDISPGQVSLNWQAMAGLNASFRISETLQFEVEPCARYYFNSVYEKPANATKPWSVGIRAAFVVKF
jgi:hypothetical protein